VNTLGTLAALTQDKPGTPWHRVGLLVPAAASPVLVDVHMTQHRGEPGWTDNLATATPSWRVAGARLACKLHEGFGNRGVMGKAVGLIGRESIAVAMV